MIHDQFEEFIKQSPRHTRLIFCYGPQLFIRDGDEYQNLAIQIAWEAWLGPTKSVELFGEVRTFPDFTIDIPVRGLKHD